MLCLLKSAKNLWLPSSQNTPTLYVPKIQKYQNSCISFSLYITQEFRMIVRTDESMLKEVIQFITTTKYFDINMVKRVVISKKIWDSFVRNHLAPYYIKLNGEAAYQTMVLAMEMMLWVKAFTYLQDDDREIRSRAFYYIYDQYLGPWTILTDMLLAPSS